MVCNGEIYNAPQLRRIVDLAVAHHPDLAVRALERLIAGRELHDRQPACADARALVTDDAFAVRPAVAQCRGHPRERVGMAQRCFAARPPRAPPPPPPPLTRQDSPNGPK